MNTQNEPKIKQVGDYILDLNKEIGSGYSSKVYLGENLKTKQIVAIKVISSQTYTSPIQKSLLKNEISILLRIDHPHLMKVYEVSQSANNTYIVTEFCNGGNLEQQMKKTEFSVPKVLSILRQITLGIQALHEKKIIHRDLKPANILIHENTYKLADFGFALIEDQFESIIKRFNVGTPLYMAPEILSTNQYSEKSDIWALGIMSYEMLFNCIPPYKSDIRTFHEEILKNCQKIDLLYQGVVKQLLFGMLQVDPNARENINQIISYISQKEIEHVSPRIQQQFIKLSYNFVQSNPNSPLSSPKHKPTMESQRQKYQKKVQSHNKAQTFASVKMLSLNKFLDDQNKHNRVSDFNLNEDHPKLISHTSAKKYLHDNHEQIGQYSTQCSFSTNNNNNTNSSSSGKKTKLKFKMQSSQLPAIVLPTYNFCIFLENLIKTMESSTEQKQKCNFLFRKLLAIKAKAFYSFAPKSIKEQLSLWIDQLNNYYEKVQFSLNFTLDNTFQIFFNSSLEDQGKLLSMYLVSLMSQIILKEQTSDFETLIDILQDNVKHQNDPFLFARKWAHNQQK
ncbi:unnamed protein product (macronuclear) [Paramecium tetraurelia]|uniref:Protein kinase domain-containing protein n=1 Tax=Paramecium tetraurelia TaxID=5888 RepID=A0E7F6_PARTE|nr:uncharacterized protein GSPATT00023951001 [Paramecium tetraurelia]CAK91223.1 unnamed protein product [Paramecium tetraurelia]|eukprot:XP_001458620.1 hypothetical protein (macronuclear) [Paramecium tetraurelia strain d4-2]